MATVKEANYAKFDVSVDVHVKLGDPRKVIRQLEVRFLPHTGKTKNCGFLYPEKEDEAAGAEYVGLDELLKSSRWMD